MSILVSLVGLIFICVLYAIIGHMAHDIVLSVQNGELPR